MQKSRYSKYFRTSLPTEDPCESEHCHCKSCEKERNRNRSGCRNHDDAHDETKCKVKLCTLQAEILDVYDMVQSIPTISSTVGGIPGILNNIENNITALSTSLTNSTASINTNVAGVQSTVNSIASTVSTLASQSSVNNIVDVVKQINDKQKALYLIYSTDVNQTYLYGTGASATATISAGMVTAITVTAPGARDLQCRRGWCCPVVAHQPHWQLQRPHSTRKVRSADSRS